MNWTQPNLTSSVGVGGNSFGCEASSTYGTFSPYKAFDGNTTTASNSWRATSSSYSAWITFYNPTAIKVSSLRLTNYTYGGSAASAATMRSGTVYGSNDNSSWTTLKTFTNTNVTAGDSWTIAVNSSDYYKYYKISGTANSGGPAIQEIKITATYLTVASNSITFPNAYSNTGYSYTLGYYGAAQGNSYCSSKTETNMTLFNSTTAQYVNYMTIGY